MKIAHISDIHFFYPHFHLKDFISNAWIGKVNALFNRRNMFITDHLDQFIQSLVNEEVETVIITGDLTTTADEREFLNAKSFIKKMIDKGIKVYGLPGNHDLYTKKSKQENRFYKLLDILPTFSSEILHHEVIKEKWDLILLDNTMINSPLKANGLFSKEHESILSEILSKDSNVIVANHFPLKDSSESHRLIGAKYLENLLVNHPYTTIYLHGHTHKTSYNKAGKNLHVINSSESCVNGKYTYHIIELNDQDFTHKEIQYYE